MHFFLRTVGTVGGWVLWGEDGGGVGRKDGWDLRIRRRGVWGF